MSESPQWRTALDTANDVRMASLATRHLIAAEDGPTGRRMVADILLAGDPATERLPVLALLRSIHQVGKVKALRWLGESGIGATRTVGSLTGRQRGYLAALLINGPRWPQ